MDFRRLRINSVVTGDRIRDKPAAKRERIHRVVRGCGSWRALRASSNSIKSLGEHTHMYLAGDGDSQPATGYLAANRLRQINTRDAKMRVESGMDVP